MSNFEQLRAPFDPARVSWRVGPTSGDKTKGLALAYIDARDVQDRLDAVWGPQHWQCRYPHTNGKTVCEIGLRIEDEWIWKADGAGDTDMEAEKGALSDAFKRAAVRWGIGRYLYDVESVWVAIEPAGKSFRIKDSELPKLRSVLGGKPTPSPAPAPKAAPKPDNARLDQEAWVSGAMLDIQGIASLGLLREWWMNNSQTITALPADLRGKLEAVKDARKTQLQQKDAA